MNRYLVINAMDIADVETPVFGGRYAEESDYRNLLEDMQKLFDEFATTGTVKAPEYDHIDDIPLKRRDQIGYDNFMRTFISTANRVTVRKGFDGRFYPVTDGFHRLYVAKKYGLKILVCVVN